LFVFNIIDTLKLLQAADMKDKFLKKQEAGGKDQQ